MPLCAVGIVWHGSSATPSASKARSIGSSNGKPPSGAPPPRAYLLWCIAHDEEPEGPGRKENRGTKARYLYNYAF